LEHFNAQCILRLCAIASKALVFFLKVSFNLPENADTQKEEDDSIDETVFIREYLSQPSESTVSFLLLELDWKDEIDVIVSCLQLRAEE
jgi:uncharacterized lipoprotein YbaY